MALKSTVYKAQVAIADMDRALYADHALTLARHPSETDERLMVRLLAFALRVPADEVRGRLEMARGLSDTDEPDLRQHDLTGALVHWIEVGQPDERRLLKACGRADRVTVLAYSASVALWWAPLAARVARCTNLEVWQLASDASRELATLAQRSMQLQVTVQDGHVWVGDGERVVELVPRRLFPA
ncbi:YaeQ family protein [Azohydromonas sediminis]|uniref:YaeQ family protein n=1 Tax=Azohydromonas sediminis TaxID=2259674 RepID=UPI000E647705|nr:YaeQ family protein [Azohydromonas sediminis]